MNTSSRNDNAEFVQREFNRYFEKARISYFAHDYVQAAELCQKALSVNPNDLTCLKLCADVALKIDREDIALSILKDTHLKHPYDLEILHMLGYLLAKEGESEDAIEFYKKAISLAIGVNSNLPLLDFLEKTVEYIYVREKPEWKKIRNYLIEIGHLLESSGIFYNHREQIESFLTAELKKVANKPFVLACVLGLYGFDIKARPNWNEFLVVRVLVPLMRSLLTDKSYNIALILEQLIYPAYIKQIETEEHFRHGFEKWKDMMVLAGYQARQDFPCSVLPTPGDGKIKVAFFVHQESELAHIQILFSFLEGLRSCEHSRIDPVVYTYGGNNPGFRNVLNKLDVELISLEDLAPQIGHSPFNKLLFIRRHTESTGTGVIVWVSLATIMSFAFALRLAKVQIWWAMKFHDYEHPEIDGYITGGTVSEHKQINNRVWRTSPTAFRDLLDTSRKPEAELIRSQYPENSIILGSFGREEKLNSTPFLAAVTRILKDNPNAIFLWTGREKIRSIQSYFESEGIACRCYFIGWVDTKLYAHVIDIFVDSFPFPCGLTIFEAMAAGKPAVLYDSKESQQTGVNGIIGPVFLKKGGTKEEQDQMESIFVHGRDSSFYLCASSPDEYVAMCSELINNPQLRVECGTAYGRFVEEFMMNKQKMARGYESHILEIIDETVSSEV